MKAVALDHVNKRFPGAACPALDDVSIAIEDGEFVTILGASGCGKTTLIKTINRLQEVDSGQVLLYGKNVQDSDPVQLRRHIGYVIQKAGLFPHMTVAENIATVPRILGWEPNRIRQGIQRMLRLVALEPEEFCQRYPLQLSGGQQQRVGLARALITDPPIMLLDEPFGAIDAINRELLQDELKRIHEASRKTCLFVTHDIREALKLGTKVMIMNQGRLLQYGTPAEILKQPAGDFVRQLLETLHRDTSYLMDGAGI